MAEYTIELIPTTSDTVEGRPMMIWHVTDEDQVPLMTGTAEDLTFNRAYNKAKIEAESWAKNFHKYTTKYVFDPGEAN